MNNLKEILKCLNSERDLIKVLRAIERMHTTQRSEYDDINELLPNITEIRKEYAKLLYEMEVASARIIQSWNDILKFYKWQIYELRCSFEISCCTHLVNKPLSNVLFVGAGAIPVSAIIACKRDLSVSALDRDEVAIDLCSRIFNKLDIPVTPIHQNLWGFNDYHQFDLIVVSGTVGVTTEEKQEIAAFIRNKCNKDTQLCFRNPVREEKVIMAPLGVSSSLNLTEYYLENSSDYISRVFVQSN